MLIKTIRNLAKKNNLVVKGYYLLDSTDRKRFVRFLGLLFIGGIVSLLGIGAVIPFAHLLIKPDSLSSLPVIGQLSYLQAVGACIVVLILAYWTKDLVSFVVLRKQNVFLAGIASKLRQKLFHCYIYSPYDIHVHRSSPELINNVNSVVNQVSKQVIASLGILINEGITSAIIVIFIITINPAFAALVVGIILLSARLFIIKFRGKAHYYGQLRVSYMGHLARCVTQGLGGIKETKIYNKEAFFTTQVKEYAQGVAFSEAFTEVFKQSPRFLIEAVAITTVMALIFAFVLAGYDSQTMLVLLTVFGMAAMQLLPSINRFMKALTSAKSSMPALERVFEELKRYEQQVPSQLDQDAHDHHKINKLPFKKQLVLQDITFSYEGKKVLDEINLTIPKGSRTAFVGESGAGKTTLVDIILGVLKPEHGSLWVDDQRVTESNLRQWQAHFGYIPQMIYIYDCSLRENIAFGLPREAIDEAQVWRVLEQASLKQFVEEECPDGLDTRVGENGIRLSGGQRQRIGIARALYHDPDILVMDEATAALDNQTEAEVTKALNEAERGRTIITIAHRLTTIQDYDTICVLDKGQVVGKGSYNYLARHCELFQEMSDY